ncbi:hypothetical protein [Ligilactobacillus murinus]|uniref:hypothetical protein n=1 Tax=Ligilactobacillus murinus TaxID=1622 RepID=UPI0012983095|nr:hypothetical protein [Ligilactobacillus murinus]
MVIFTKGEIAGVKSYFTLGDVQEDFAQNSYLLAVAQGYLAQKMIDKKHPKIYIYKHQTIML